MSRTTTSKMLDLLKPGEPLYFNDNLKNVTALATYKGLKIKAKTVYIIEDLKEKPLSLLKVVLQ
jgi:hypothetical protein